MFELELFHGTGDVDLEARSGEDEDEDEVPPELGLKSLAPPLRVERRLWFSRGRACVDGSRAPDRSEAGNEDRESAERRVGAAVSASGFRTGWAPGMEACLTDWNTDLKLGDESGTCASTIVRVNTRWTASEPGANHDVT